MSGNFVYLVTVTRENTPLLHLLIHVHFPVMQFSWVRRLLCNFSFQSVSVRMRGRDSLTMNPERLGEEVMKGNALHPVLRELRADATLAEEDSRTYPLKGEVLNLGLGVHPSRLLMAWEAYLFSQRHPRLPPHFLNTEYYPFKANAFGWKTCEPERHT